MTTLQFNSVGAAGVLVARISVGVGVKMRGVSVATSVGAGVAVGAGVRVGNKASAVCVAMLAAEGVRVGNTSSSTGTVQPSDADGNQPLICWVVVAYTQFWSSLRSVTLNISRLAAVPTEAAAGSGALRRIKRVLLLTMHIAKKGLGGSGVGEGKPAWRVASMRAEMRAAASGSILQAESNDAAQLIKQTQQNSLRNAAGAQ